MKDPARQPTRLTRLAELISNYQFKDAEYSAEGGEIVEWLTWTYNFLSARKEYHRKARIKSAMLERMAKTLLSKDELDMIDKEAESQLAGPGDNRDEDETPAEQDPARNREEIGW